MAFNDTIKFNEEKLKYVLQENSNGLMLRHIRLKMGCSETTARNLLKPLLANGKVFRNNISDSEIRPLYLYFWND